MPYYSVATHERVPKEGILATAETFGKILSSSVPSTHTGVPVLEIFDIHALPVRFYLTDNVRVQLNSAIPLLKKRIDKRAIICFPDDGAFKRFNYDFEDYHIIVCGKIRDGNTRKVKIQHLERFPQNVDYSTEVIIVDDLVQSGGTLEECRKVLEAEGYTKISAYVTHAVFPNKGYLKFFNSKFHKFYTTNSIPEIASKLTEDPFEVFDITSCISDTTHVNISKNIKNIYVASTNEIKLNAVYKAFSEIYHQTHFNVYGINCSSDVPEQPIGEQTLQGATNRLNKLKSYYNKGICISIENGVFINDDNSVYDKAIICIHENNITKITETSEVPFPKEFYLKSIEYNQEKTCGSLMEEYYGIKKGKWFNYFGYDRTDLIKCSIKCSVIL